MVIIGNKMTETLQMLTPEEVAGILGVHRKTVHLWLRNGKLKGVKISYRAWRIPRSALEQFIEQNSNVPVQTGAEDPKMAGSTCKPSGAPPKPPAEGPDTPQITMKQYLQDIMGVQDPEKDPGSPNG
jgi:excisionase family DNA binding protein